MYIFDIHSDYAVRGHFNAVFYAMVQVYFGKALLVDLVNQYGLYPHFLEPIFKIIGLSIFNFTVIMEVLLGISILCIFKFLNEIIKNKTICFCGFASFIFYSYLFMNLLVPDPYFQYHPVRILFPALMIYLSWRYFINNSRSLYYSSFLLYSIAFLWNFDTGLVVFFSWLLTLLYQELFQSNLKIASKKILSHLIVGILIFSTTFISYILYIYFRYGDFPDFNMFFAYQRYFYISGYLMLPMKLIHLWNIVILIYMVGLSYSVKTLVARNNTAKANMVFLLSILGVGIFSYYQGRSHDLVLMDVWYPAILLLVIFADDLFYSIKNDIKNYGKILLFVSLLFVLSSSVFSILDNYPAIYKQIDNRVQITLKQEPTSVTRDADFVRNHTTKGEEVLILSYKSGVYYLYSQTTSPLKIPGFIEIYLKKDYDKIYDFLKNGEGNKVFLDTDFVNANYKFNSEVLRILFQNYKASNLSQDKNIILFTKGTNIQRNDEKMYLLNDTEKNILHYKYDHETTFYFNKGVMVLLATGIEPLLYLSDSFTIEVIVKPSKNQVAYADIIGNHPGYNYYEGFVIQQDNQNQNVYTFGFGNGKEWLPGVKFKLNEEKWNYLAVVVVEKNMIKVFNNGILVASVDAKDSIKNSKMPLEVGNWINGDRPFNGLIEEVRISNGSLSENEILSNWQEIQVKLSKQD